MSLHRPAPGQVLHAGPGGEDHPRQGRHRPWPHLNPQEGQVCGPGDGEGEGTVATLSLFGRSDL